MDIWINYLLFWSPCNLHWLFLKYHGWKLAFTSRTGIDNSSIISILSDLIPEQLQASSILFVKLLYTSLVHVAFQFYPWSKLNLVCLAVPNFTCNQLRSQSNDK